MNNNTPITDRFGNQQGALILPETIVMESINQDGNRVTHGYRPYAQWMEALVGAEMAVADCLPGFQVELFMLYHGEKILVWRAISE